MKILLLGAVLGFYMSSSFANDSNELLRYLDQHGEKFDSLALELWDFAELGYLEFQSSTKLPKVLADEGFEIKANVAGIPTAFVASFGEGKPVIGILAEFDALPGISQAALSSRQLLEGKESGHACGHHLFGAGSTAAAIAVRHRMENNNVKGTVRLYGTPAEEGVPVKFI
jgi:aminobenzoyl-glutamate utilization protein B